MSSKLTKNEEQRTLKNVDLSVSKLHVKYLEYICNNIINNSLNYPPLTRTTKLNSQKHALYRRQFENSMLCYDVSNCDCCGNICINYDDNLLKKENVLLNDIT